MAKIESAKQFSDKLRGIKVSATALRENIQSLIEYGLEQYRDHNGNATPLTELLTVIHDVKTVSSKTIKLYIGAHANVAWQKNKATGKMRFVKAGKDVKVTMPDKVWWAHEAVKQQDAKPDFVDPIAKVKATFGQLADALEAGKVHPERAPLVKEMVEALDKFLRMESLAKADLKTPAAIQA